MADDVDAEIDAAELRGSELLAHAPRAVSARYDAASRRIVLEMANGCAYAFPPKLVEDLQNASDADLAGVVVDGAGFNLHWPALDADLWVPGLVDGVFGTRRWAERIGGHRLRRPAPGRKTAER